MGACGRFDKSSATIFNRCSSLLSPRSTALNSLAPQAVSPPSASPSPSAKATVQSIAPSPPQMICLFFLALSCVHGNRRDMGNSQGFAGGLAEFDSSGSREQSPDHEPLKVQRKGDRS